MALCIQQGKSDFIKNVTVTYVLTKWNNRVFMNTVVTKFQGNFTLSERIQIHGAAPLLILSFLCLVLVAVLLLTQIPFQYVFWFWLFLISFPIGSLLPFRILIESDGYSVLKYARRLRLSAFQIVKELSYGMFLGLRYVFLGSWGVRKSDNVADTRLTSALKSVQKGDFTNAVSILEEELKSNQNNPEIYNNIAWCYAELGINLDRAIMLAEKAIDFDPAEAMYHDTLGWCYFKKRDIDKAKDSVSLAIKIDPHNSIFHDHMKTIENAITKITQKD